MLCPSAGKAWAEKRRQFLGQKISPASSDNRAFKKAPRCLCRPRNEEPHITGYPPIQSPERSDQWRHRHYRSVPGNVHRYIDSGFGLLGGEVGYSRYHARGYRRHAGGSVLGRGSRRGHPGAPRQEDYYSLESSLSWIGNWNSLARAIFESFAGLGLKASGTGLSSPISSGPEDCPGRAGCWTTDPRFELGPDGLRQLLREFIQIAVLLFAWIVVLLAFFILAIQLFITLIEFKLTTLAGLC